MESIGQDKEKHLEFIQSNIARMNQCSFQMKGWMITLVTALLALFAASYNSIEKTGNNLFIFIAAFPAILFWFLDSYYLQQERKMRGLYKDIIDTTSQKKIANFSFPLDSYKGGKYKLLNVMFSITEWPLYLLTCLALIIAGIVL